MPIPNAARVGDPIEHTSALMGALTGIAVGLVVGAAIAATVLTGGVGALAIMGAISIMCTGVAAGFSIGKLLGSIGKSKSGVIGEGAKTVFIGEGLPPAARALDKLACGDPPSTKFGWSLLGAVLLGPIGAVAGYMYGVSSSAHGGAQIATGSETVYIEQRNAARVGDQTSCSGKIIEGSKTVGIGGPTVALIDPKDWSPEVPLWLENTVYYVDKVGVVLGFVSGLGSMRTLLATGWKNASWTLRLDAVLPVGDVALLGAEELSTRTLGSDSAITQTIVWTRTAYEIGSAGRSGWNAWRDMRAPHVSTPDIPTSPHLDTPDVPHVDAPDVPHVNTPDVPTTPRPVPEGGQTIGERMANGGNPPPYARQTPDNYYYDPVAGRYKRR